MRARRRYIPNAVTVLLMWLLPLCSVINSGLELLVIPGNAPKISRRWDYNGENNSVYAEKDVHHIPPAHRHSRHHQLITIAAVAPPQKPSLADRPVPHYRQPAPPYRAAFPFDTFPEITVPPPEHLC